MTRIIAELKRLHSPDVNDLNNYVPDDRECFSFLLQAMFGPSNGPGEESFDMIVCTPAWLMRKLKTIPVYSAEYHLVVKEYKISEIETFLRNYVLFCSGETWKDVALKLTKIGKWEFL